MPLLSITISLHVSIRPLSFRELYPLIHCLNHNSKIIIIFTFLYTHKICFSYILVGCNILVISIYFGDTCFFYKKSFYKKPRATEAKKFETKGLHSLTLKKLFYCETENRLLFFKFCWKITEKAKN